MVKAVMHYGIFLCGMILITLFSALNAQEKNEARDLTRYVDPFIGTAGHGHTFPGAALPFSMVQPGPDTGTEGWDWCSGYNYQDSSIMGFSHTHLNGTGVGDMGDFLFMPGVGRLRTEPGDKYRPGSGYRSRFSHKNETAQPGYYSVYLDDYKIKAELTATLHSAFHRYTFPRSDSAFILIDLRHSIGNNKILMSTVSVKSDSVITGYHQVSGMVKNRYIYFAARFSRPFTSYGLKLNEELLTNWPEESSDKLLAYVNFKTKRSESVLVKVGISQTSTAEALSNLDKEIPDWNFDRVRLEAKEAWNKELAKIQVAGSNKEKTIFYTALYHSFLTPNISMDVSGTYRGYDWNIHNANGAVKYSTFSLWDTFRAAHPLYTILQPGRVNDFINSLLLDYEQNTHQILPIWPLANSETWAMTGYHSVPVIADAYMKGFRGYDKGRAFTAMVASATHGSYEGLDQYMKLGYVPADMIEQSATKTLEYAYDDWCIAHMAQAMELTGEYNSFYSRSNNYRNTFDSTRGFMRGRNSDGSWSENFNPLNANYGNDFTEGNAWQYTWFVPQDIPGLITLLGGSDKFILKLDSLFNITKTLSGTPPDLSGSIGQYAHGNEPGHHIPYLYNYAGVPWKSQKIISEIMSSLYTDKPDGLCGNEDCGQMSAWYIFSALGFYPVNPASGIYVFGSPAVEEARIMLEGGHSFSIKVHNPGAGNIYIKSVTLNGKPYNKTWIRHADIMKGGVLEFEMSRTPEKKWGSGEDARPPLSE